MPRTKKQLAQQQDSDNNNDQSEDSQNQLKVNTDNSPKIIPVGKLPDKLKCKKIVLNVSDTQYPIVAEIGQQLGWVVQQQEGSGDWDVWWTDREIEANTLYRMNLHQKINHFPGIYVLARKNLLGLHLMAMQRRFPNEYNFFPQTWMLPMQFHQFRQYYQSVQENKVRTYIVKPQALSQGRGIFLTRNIQELINGRKYVVQKYLKNPLLLDGLKFDLRIYVLLAGTEPLRLYIYEQGLARLATRPYQPPTTQNMHQNYIHLTNYSLNKSNPEYIFNKSDKQMDTGHKRSLKSVYERLAKNGIDIQRLKNQIQQSIIKTIISGLPSIRHQYQYCQPQDYQGNMCFHILGFDVMILDDHKPIVIEVNHTPSFQTSTPLDYTIKKNLIKDTLKLMRISAKHKKELFLKSKQLTKKRVQTGKRDIMKGQQRRAHLQKYQKIRDQQQKQILFNTQKPSGYKVIFPFKNEQKNNLYKKYYQAAEQVMRKLKDTRKKIISEQKSSSSLGNKQPSTTIGSGKNVKSAKNNSNNTQSISIKQVISDKAVGRKNSSSLKMIEEIKEKEVEIESQRKKDQFTQVDSNNQQQKNHHHQQLRKFSSQLLQQNQTKDVYSPTITKNNFQIRNNTSKSIKNQQPPINIKHSRKPSFTSSINQAHTLQAQNTKYNELINRFVNSKDLQNQHQAQNMQQRISLQGQILIQQKFSSNPGNKRSRNSCQQMVLNKFHSINQGNVLFDMRQKLYIQKQQIVVPIIKGYKQRVNNKNTITTTPKQNMNSYKNYHHQKVDMNVINLSAKPSIVENLFVNNQTQIEQKNVQLKKYGKFIKPKTFNLNQNNFSNLHQKTKKIVRMESQGFSIINSNNKSQTQYIIHENNIKNLTTNNNTYYNNNHSLLHSVNNQHNLQLSNNIIPAQRSYGSRTKVNINNSNIQTKNNNNKGCSSLIGKPLTGYKNKSNSMIGKINSAHYKDNQLLFKMVKQRHRPQGYQ